VIVIVWLLDLQLFVQLMLSPQNEHFNLLVRNQIL